MSSPGLKKCTIFIQNTKYIIGGIEQEGVYRLDFKFRLN